MHFIFRNFFYSVGLVMLLSTWALDPATAQFKDFIVLLHAGAFWTIVSMFFVMLVSAESVFNGTAAKMVDFVFNTWSRIRHEPDRNPNN